MQLNKTSLVFETVDDQVLQNENIVKMNSQSNMQAGIYIARYM